MDFQSEKSFEKLRHRAFQTYHQITCILKHVGDVGDRSSTPKGCNAMWNISIKDQKHCTEQCYICWRHQRCEISQCYVITVLRYFTSPMSPTWEYSNYIALRYFISPTWVTLLCIVLPLTFYWDISHLQHLWHALPGSFVLTILTNPLMYTQQMRWQWVWMSGFLTI